MNIFFYFISSLNKKNYISNKINFSSSSILFDWPLILKKNVNKKSKFFIPGMGSRQISHLSLLRSNEKLNKDFFLTILFANQVLKHPKWTLPAEPEHPQALMRGFSASDSSHKQILHLCPLLWCIYFLFFSSSSLG